MQCFCLHFGCWIEIRTFQQNRIGQTEEIGYILVYITLFIGICNKIETPDSNKVFFYFTTNCRTVVIREFRVYETSSCSANNKKTVFIAHRMLNGFELSILIEEKIYICLNLNTIKILSLFTLTGH